MFCDNLKSCCRLLVVPNSSKGTELVGRFAGAPGCSCVFINGMEGSLRWTVAVNGSIYVDFAGASSNPGGPIKFTAGVLVGHVDCDADTS